MERLQAAIKQVFDERGVTLPSWRIKITDREIIGRSDWAKVNVEIYKPRKKKPTYIYNLAINFVRNIIDWEKSEFITL